MQTQKKAIVTGATSGIGKETVKALLNKDYQVIVPARNMEKAEDCLTYWNENDNGNNIDLMYCDLASLQSVREFSANYIKNHKTLDLLVNNAGIMDSKRVLSNEGHERMLAVNHLAPFLLTGLLIDIMPAGSRIVNVASEAHRAASFNATDINHAKGYNAFRVYGHSKLCNILFTNKLSEKLKNKSITVNSLHPGFVSTGLFENINSFLKKILSFFMIDAQKGAQTTIYLSLSDEVTDVTGKYFVKCKAKRPSRAALSQDNTNKLWVISEELTELRY
ncbi:MAG: SDR family oxidoreductase [Chitinophagaceae bacterium]|nr:MAG: SDR family oxidoreductase [Chitinophagaceae bacterium]